MRKAAGSEIEKIIPDLIKLWCKKRSSSKLADAELSRISKGLLTLQRGLTGERVLPGLPYMEDEKLLGAYLLYYWPSSYAQTLEALGEIGKPIKKALDLGSGPGPSSAALFTGGAVSVLAADGSPRALEMAGRLLSGKGHAFKTIRIDLEREGLSGIRETGFDAIIFSHSLNELWRDKPDRLKRRKALLESALELLSDEGFLLALEPALLVTSRELISLRDSLLEGGDLRVLAPCFFQGACPALAAGPAQTCHMSVPWKAPPLVESLALAAGLKREELKMAYFALCSKKAPSARGVSDLSEDLETSCDLYRVVSDPMLNKAGKTRIFLCGQGGRFALSARKSELPLAAKDFLKIRRSDRVRASGLVPWEAGPKIGPETRMEILARPRSLSDLGPRKTF